MKVVADSREDMLTIPARLDTDDSCICDWKINVLGEPPKKKEQKEEKDEKEKDQGKTDKEEERLEFKPYNVKDMISPVWKWILYGAASVCIYYLLTSHSPEYH
jgi:hypothetical protein